MVLTGEVARVAEASWAAKVTMEEASTEVGGMAVRAKGGDRRAAAKKEEVATAMAKEKASCK